MARREPDFTHDSNPLKGGLKHNPFAALRGAGAAPAPKPADAEAEPTPRPASASPPRARSDSKPRATEKPPQRAPAAARDRVTVRQERAGHGGKTVTIAEGPGLDGRDLEVLARELARALGAGARVEDKLLVVQGDQRDRLARWLASHGFVGVVRGN